MSDAQPGPPADAPSRERPGQEPPSPPLFRIDRKMIVLLVCGAIAALLIFWFEPSFTLRYVVVGVLGAIYVFLRFNDWR
jgi:hypothetical protein